MRGRYVAVAGAALVIAGAGVKAASGAARAQPAPGATVAVTVVPERVCHDDRQPAYLNFDLHMRSGTDRELRIGELRAAVLDADGAVVERRLIWQQAVSLLEPTPRLAAGGEGLLHNPLLFNSVQVGSRIRYELHFDDAAVAPVTVEVVPESCVTRAQLILPLVGRVFVHDGYDLVSHHRRKNFATPAYRRLGIYDNFQRFGIDLVHVDEDLNLFSGDPAVIESWYSWGQPVRATGGGVVTAVHNDQPDNDIGTENRWTQRDLSEEEMTSYGNYVLIDHGDGEFSLLSHLRAGSVRVRAGDRVAAGDIIAEVGNSGSSPVPHIHYELRTGLGVRGVRSLPAYFHDVTVLGTGEGTSGEAVALNTGDVVSAR